MSFSIPWLNSINDPRDMIHDCMLRLFKDKKIGGPGCTVEIDESQFGRNFLNLKFSSFNARN